MLLVLGDVGDVTNRPGGIAVLREFTLEIEPPRTLFRVQQFDLKTFAQPRRPRGWAQRLQHPLQAARRYAAP